MAPVKDYKWPEGKKFAFSIFDDTDLSTVDNIKPVYDFLHDLGFSTTKSVWPIIVGNNSVINGTTCADQEYRKFVLDLQSRGFEIGYHLASYNSALREQTQQGLEVFKQLFNHYPKVMANHSANHEGMYWGDARLSGINRDIYSILVKIKKMLTRSKRKKHFTGHIPGDPRFWGDLCHKHIKYVRNFTFNEVVTTEIDSVMPYHDPDRPFVQYWFSNCDGSHIDVFCRNLNKKNIDRLANSGGACIIYTHFACGFLENGSLNQKFKEIMEYLVKQDGWFVPVSTLLDHMLDHMLDHKKNSVISPSERAGLERRWIWEQITSKRSAWREPVG